MTMPPSKVRKRLRDLHARLGAGDQEAAVARKKLLALLAEHGLTWNDVPAILAHDQEEAAAEPPQRRGPPDVNVLDLTLELVGRHIAVSDDERLAVALWVLHTHVYDRFAVTPRLALLSPVNGCGKSTLLKVLKLLTREPVLSAHTTPAPIYYRLQIYPQTTWLLDEADNLNMGGNALMRSVLNMGHTRGFAVHRQIPLLGTMEIPVFSPVAVAAIGTLPFPLLRRSVIVHMQRPGRDARLERLDEQQAHWTTAAEQIARWAANCTLAPDPAIPSRLRDRVSDNWRVLLSVADDLGYGDAARAAAVRLSANRIYTEPGIALLDDIHTVFDQRKADRIASVELATALLALSDGDWNEWRGPKEDRPPHKLTQSELATMLRPFGIVPRTVRFSSSTARGYHRSQFEAAWSRYCSQGDTAAQSSNVRQLVR